MITAAQLRAMSRAELASLLRSGHPIDASALDDTEYRGVSLGLPAIIEKLTWKTFKKVFHRDPKSGLLRGWNVRIRQDLPAERYEPMMRNDKPLTFGHYEVVSARAGQVPKGCDRGLLIHYGLGNNGRFDPTSRLRDPIVAVNQGDAGLLLGWSYLELGVARIPTPSFFSLERDTKLTHRVPQAA